MSWWLLAIPVAWLLWEAGRIVLCALLGGILLTMLTMGDGGGDG